MNSEGFGYIGFGIMVLCICFGCSHCERSRYEIESLKAKDAQHEPGTPTP